MRLTSNTAQQVRKASAAQELDASQPITASQSTNEFNSKYSLFLRRAPIFAESFKNAN
jgi:hypothetical protein